MSTTNILIIEDNPADIALIEAYLKDAALKHTLFKSESLSDGLDFLKESKVDLVLLDLKLEDVEGFKTLQLFREKAPDIPVIVLTGFKNEIVGIQSVRAGAQDFLVKGDFDSRSLARTIRYSLQRFEAQARLQKKANELSHNERRNQLAHQIARFGKWEMDIVSNAMKWDEEIFHFFGFPPHSFEPTLSDYLKYVHVEDRERVEAFFEQAIKDGQPHHIDHRIIIDNTIVRYLQIKAQVNYDEQSNRIVLVGGIQDITELKKAHGQEEWEAVPAKNPAPLPIEEDMLSEFNFNLRTPLASMVNLLYLLENTSTSSRQQDYINGLKSSLDHLSFALNNWLNLSLLREPSVEVKKSEVSLEEAIRILKNVTRIRSEQTGLSLAFELSGKLPAAIITDQQKFAQILYNLIEAAIRNSQPGSTAKVFLQPKGNRKGRALLHFRVDFENRSISPEEIERLLGLAGKGEFNVNYKQSYLPIIIAAKLAGVLQGQIQAAQKNGKWISLSLELPVKLPEIDKPPIPDSPQAPLKILLVEDHDLHRLATKRMLMGWSGMVTVDLARNGKEAVGLVQQNNYDVILMDLQMPVLNGIESAIKIRSRSSVPIIAMTANESKQEKERCFMIGINDYVAKPIRPEAFFSRIMQQLYGNGQ